MASIDYAYKSYVLKEHSDLIKRYKKASKYEYCRRLYEEEGIVTKTIKNGSNETLNDIDFDCFINGTLKELVEVEKIVNASYCRAKRLYKRMAKLLYSGACCFLTINFNDDTLNKTNSVTRRKYVTRYLKSLDCPYIANIDFGAKYHREHYHAVVRLPSVPVGKDCSWFTAGYGCIKSEKVWTDCTQEANKKRLSKYICKLTNHAIKETTKRSCVIYSR